VGFLCSILAVFVLLALPTTPGPRNLFTPHSSAGQLAFSCWTSNYTSETTLLDSVSKTEIWACAPAQVSFIHESAVSPLLPTSPSRCSLPRASSAPTPPPSPKNSVLLCHCAVVAIVLLCCCCYCSGLVYPRVRRFSPLQTSPSRCSLPQRFLCTDPSSLTKQLRAAECAYTRNLRARERQAGDPSPSLQHPMSSTPPKHSAALQGNASESLLLVPTYSCLLEKRLGVWGGRQVGLRWVLPACNRQAPPRCLRRVQRRCVIRGRRLCGLDTIPHTLTPSSPGLLPIWRVSATCVSTPGAHWGPAVAGAKGEAPQCAVAHGEDAAGVPRGGLRRRAQDRLRGTGCTLVYSTEYSTVYSTVHSTVYGVQQLRGTVSQIDCEVQCTLQCTVVYCAVQCQYSVQ